jgi:hypothetical protein
MSIRSINFSSAGNSIMINRKKSGKFLNEKTPFFSEEGLVFNL